MIYISLVYVYLPIYLCIWIENIYFQNIAYYCVHFAILQFILYILQKKLTGKINTIFSCILSSELLKFYNSYILYSHFDDGVVKLIKVKREEGREKEQKQLHNR